MTWFSTHKFKKEKFNDLQRKNIKPKRVIYDFQNKMDCEPKSQTILKHFSSLSVIK